jgi:hypothetical protein
MKELYLETEHGRERIDEQTVEKYHLESGTLSPFTQNRIVGENGEYRQKDDPDADDEASIRQDFDDMPLQGIRGDGLDEMDNGFVMSQSEIIDFSQGVDSRMDENR